MIYTNADCLSASKRSELECTVELQIPDIIAITEVSPKNKEFELSDTIYQIEGYDMFSTNLTLVEEL